MIFITEFISQMKIHYLAWQTRKEQYRQTQVALSLLEQHSSGYMSPNGLFYTFTLSMAHSVCITKIGLYCQLFWPQEQRNSYVHGHSPPTPTPMPARACTHTHN